MFKLDVLVKLKKDVLDPQGKAIELAAKNINLNNIYSIKQNKYFEIIVEKVPNQDKAKEVVEKLSKNLLANEVIEDFKIISSKKILRPQLSYFLAPIVIKIYFIL